MDGGGNSSKEFELKILIEQLGCLEIALIGPSTLPHACPQARKGQN